MSRGFVFAVCGALAVFGLLHLVMPLAAIGAVVPPEKPSVERIEDWCGEEPEPSCIVLLAALHAQVETTNDLAAQAVDSLAALEEIRSEVRKPVSLAEPVEIGATSISDLSAAIADEATPVSAAGTLPEDPWSDSRVRLAAGLLIGLWVATRIYRLIIPGG